MGCSRPNEQIVINIKYNHVSFRSSPCQGWAQETISKTARRNARPKFNANNAKRKNAKLGEKF